MFGILQITFKPSFTCVLLFFCLQKIGNYKLEKIFKTVFAKYSIRTHLMFSHNNTVCSNPGRRAHWCLHDTNRNDFQK